MIIRAGTKETTHVGEESTTFIRELVDLVVAVLRRMQFAQSTEQVFCRCTSLGERELQLFVRE